MCASEPLWLHSNLHCYLFSSDQSFITHVESWLRLRELPGLVAGALDLPISVCLLLFHSRFLPFFYSPPPPHTGSLIYLAFVNSSSLFTSSSGIQIVHLFQPPLLSPVSVSLFSHQSPDYLYQYISKVTPLTHISPSSSLTLIFNIFFVPFSLLLTKHRRSSWPCPSAERFWWIRPVSFSLPPPNKAVLPGLRY